MSAVECFKKAVFMFFTIKSTTVAMSSSTLENRNHNLHEDGALLSPCLCSNEQNKLFCVCGGYSFI